jgi:hypothetical protein
MLHNNINQDGSFNDSWDPEIANYGALYAPFVLGLLGLQYTAEGLKFHITGLTDLTELETKLYFNQEQFQLQLNWENHHFTNGTLSISDSQTHEAQELFLPSPIFLLTRDWQISDL